jgi:methylmalonyl-CoA/ethylmalonyl-CoA epimerase
MARSKKQMIVDHVAVAVLPGELEHQIRLYEALGYREVHREEMTGPDQVREVLLRAGDGPNAVQLLEPLSDASPVAKQIAKNGGRGGLAHVAFRVDDARATFDKMKNAGFQIVDEAPRRGSAGSTVFFVHPKSLGYLMEIVEEAR